MRKIYVVVGAVGLAVVLALIVRQNAGGAVVYETAKVVQADIEAAVTAVGTVEPRRYVDLGAQVSGQITHIHAKPGDAVETGQLLVEIDPSVQQAAVDAGRAQSAGLHAQLAEQRAQHQLARRQLDRQRQMSRDGATRLEDVHIAEAALAVAAARIDHLQAQIAQMHATLKADEARLGYTRIYAPMDGTVVSVDAREGQTLNAAYQTPNILRIADLSTMTIWAEVSEADVQRVQVGMPARFTTMAGYDDAQPRSWRSVIRQVLPAPRVHGANGAGAGAGQNAAPVAKAVMYTALFDVDNGDGALMPQMTAQVSIVSASASGVLAVPLMAVRQEFEETQGWYVRLLGPGSKPLKRKVEPGVRNRHLVQILDGLQEGDRVIVGERPADDPFPWLRW